MYTTVPLDPLRDAASIASCNGGAFYADKHWRHQHGTTPLSDVIANTTLRTPWTLVASRQHLRCLKVVDPQTGDLIAYARWILPDSMSGDESVWPEALVPAVGKEDMARFRGDWSSTNDPATGFSRVLNKDLVMALAHLPGRMDHQIRKKYSDRLFLELDYLAVRNEWQGKGLGTMLVKLGIDKARELGCHLIIMGFTDKGRGLYQRMGDLRYEGEVRQVCDKWKEGRAPDCECVCAFWVWLWTERNTD